MTANGWDELAPDYERARQRMDSFDRILEWPAQLRALGAVTGLTILDVGCGSGAKAIELAERGATEVVGIDISPAFVAYNRDDVTLVQGDHSDLAQVPAVRGRRFDRILFFQTLGYSRDQARTLSDARDLLAPGGKILVQRSHPIRYAVERAEANGTSLGQEYYSTDRLAYRTSWNPDIVVSHSNETVSSILNTLAAAGLAIDAAIEPELSAEDQRRFPHKQARLDTYLGVIIFVLSPR